MTKILFVCTGNICRSPMAEVIFANLCSRNGKQDVIIKGAGTHAVMGEQMTPQARTALRLCGETVGDTPRPSTLFTPGMVHEFDHIITMTHDHAREIGAYPNVRCLDTITGCGDIFDPYMYPVEVYVGVCKILQGALGILYNKLFTVNESN